MSTGRILFPTIIMKATKKVQRPVESDYMVGRDSSLREKILDTAKYNAALNQYELKMLRDQLREELDKIDLGLAIGDEYTCFCLQRRCFAQTGIGHNAIT